MTLNASQRRVAEFIRENGLQTSAQVRLLDLSSELGELSKEYLKASAYGSVSFEATDGWRDEFGDVLFALLALSVESNVDIDSALKGALEKYRRRALGGGTVGSDTARNHSNDR